MFASGYSFSSTPFASASSFSCYCTCTAAASFFFWSRAIAAVIFSCLADPRSSSSRNISSDTLCERANEGYASDNIVSPILKPRLSKCHKLCNSDDASRCKVMLSYSGSCRKHLVFCPRIGYVRGYGDLANVMLCYKAKRRKGPDTQGQDALIAQKQKCGI